MTNDSLRDSLDVKPSFDQWVMRFANWATAFCLINFLIYLSYFFPVGSASKIENGLYFLGTHEGGVMRYTEVPKYVYIILFIHPIIFFANFIVMVLSWFAIFMNDGTFETSLSRTSRKSDFDEE